ncbi:hypothetical protein CR513_16617, partial [Mucuna pruriens]
MKINGVPKYAIRFMRITSQEDLEMKFMSKYFPLSKYLKLNVEITSFLYKDCRK